MTHSGRIFPLPAGSEGAALGPGRSRGQEGARPTEGGECGLDLRGPGREARGPGHLLGGQGFAGGGGVPESVAVASGGPGLRSHPAPAPTASSSPLRWSWSSQFSQRHILS